MLANFTTFFQTSMVLNFLQVICINLCFVDLSICLIRRLEEFQAREFARMRLEEAENEELDETIDW